MRVRLVAIAAAFALVAILTLGGGCSNQGEGERCDTRGQNNGTDDCQSGLQCFKPSDLNGVPTTDQYTGRCCPPDRTRATTDVCRLGSTPVGADAAPPADASLPDVQVSDSGADTAPPSDTGAPDTGTDAAGDAPAD